MRKEKVDLDVYLGKLKDFEIFRTRIVMRAFICHLTRPLEWPIFDRFVWFARNYIQSKETDIFKEPTKVDQYKEYIAFFNELAAGRNDISTRKEVDEALMAYGKFLSKYKKGD